MTKVERFGYLSNDEAKKAAEEVITYFETELEQEIGYIGAEEILDFFMQKVGPYIYNRGIEDSREILKKGFDDLDVELGVLRKDQS